MIEYVSQKLHEQVYDHIRDMIRSGVYKQDDLLPGENELARQMGVSRVTVRTALRQLSEEGIIQTRKGKGSVVAIDWEGLLEGGNLSEQAEEYQSTFLQSSRARKMIEPMIAMQAALTASEDDIAQMEAALENRDDELVLAPLMGRTSRLVDFHTCVWSSLHNPVLMTIWQHLSETSSVIAQLPFVPPTHRDGQKIEAWAQHRKIFEAIKNRKGEYAYLYMMEHCDWIIETYGQYFTDFLK